MQIQVTNVGQVDILVDVNGAGNVEDKIILHPKTSQPLTIDKSVFSTIKSTPNLVVAIIKENK